MEINFEKRYIPIYTLIIAIAHHVILNINTIYDEIIRSVWPIDAIILILMLLILSIFNGEQKQRIALGIIYKKSPFQKADEYIKKDTRICKEGKKIEELKNISNDKFYSEYYKIVRENGIIKTKNSEYCVIRDIVFTIFCIGIIIIILTIIWPSYFYRELIANIIAYIIGVIACRKKAKDFVSQIVIENNMQKGGKKNEHN